jgi:GH35 family endo-1,4-beta-xylanase
MDRQTQRCDEPSRLIVDTFIISMPERYSNNMWQWDVSNEKRGRDKIGI